jgi:hypothetical protein
MPEDFDFEILWRDTEATVWSDARIWNLNLDVSVETQSTTAITMGSTLLAPRIIVAGKKTANMIVTNVHLRLIIFI